MSKLPIPINTNTSQSTLPPLPPVQNPSTLETEQERFSRYCGFVKTGQTTGIRKYGRFEASGTVINLKHNRFIKKSGTENASSKAVSDVTSYTREAFYVEVDKKALTSPRDISIIDTLPDQENSLFRVKHIKYGNHNAMWEVLSGQLYGLTGLTAPDTRFLVHADKMRPDGTPEILVASPKIIGYHDIGDFLIDDVIQRLFDSKSQETLEAATKTWKTAKIEIEKINQKATSGETITDQDKSDRLRFMKQILHLLPNYFHNEIEKSFAASKFIANWDFSNLNLNNIGCRFTVDREGDIIGFESVFVDFGNSGAIGFGGKYKELSLERANTEAKAKSANEHDYDPALAFNELEKSFIEKRAKELALEEINKTSLNNSLSSMGSSWAIVDQNTSSGSSQQPTPDELTEEEWKSEISAAISDIVRELAEDEATLEKRFSDDEINLRRSIIFKTSHHILPQETSMKVGATTGLLTFSDLPRNLPIAILLEPALAAKTRAALELEDSNDVLLSHLEFASKIAPGDKKLLRLQSSFYRDSEVEMAYRLSLITDEAIEKVVKKWYICEEFPVIFPLPVGLEDEEQYHTAESVAKIFKSRRDDLIALIPEEIIKNWIAKNTAQALAAKQEVELAISQRTRVFNPDFDFNPTEDPTPESPTIRKSHNISTISTNPAQAILEKIEHHKLTFIKSESALESAARVMELQKELDETEVSRVKTRTLLQEAISNERNEQEQLQTEAMIDFINDHIATWKKSLDLDSKPNCSFFDLNILRNIYLSEHPSKNPPSPEGGIITGERNYDNNKRTHEINSFVCKRFIENLTELSTSISQKSHNSSQTTSTNLADTGRPRSNTI